MRRISRWAKSHPWHARILIVLLYIPLNIAAICAGNLLFELNAPISGAWYLAIGFTTIAGLGIYFNAKRYAADLAYTHRVTGHFMLLAATFGMICVLANRMNDHENLVMRLGTTVRAAAMPKSTVLTENKPPSYKTMGRKQVKQLRRYVLKTIRHTKALSTDEKVLLTIAVIIGAVALAAVLAALSCSIACSGAEVLAVFVLALGAGGIAVATTFLIRHIFRHPTRKVTPSLRATNHEQPVF